ncbi:MAG: hypothetical protein AAF598_14725 [Bacteroidota bacterium]
MKRIQPSKVFWSSLFSSLLLGCILQSCQFDSNIKLAGLWELRFDSASYEGYWIEFSADQTFELNQWDDLTSNGTWNLTSKNILLLEQFGVGSALDEQAEWLIQIDQQQPDKLVLRRTNPEVGDDKSSLFLSRIQHQPTKS